VLYLNSFFDAVFTIKPLLAKKIGLIKSCSIVLAPRGEFSTGALALKSIKKKLFIRFSNWLGLYRDVTWQASSELEKQDIVRALNVDPSAIFIAKDLPPKSSMSAGDRTLKANVTCRIVFLSRISPMKNLDFSLRVLGKVKSSLIFDIYGPVEDEEYWRGCLRLIEKLPINIKANYCGAVAPDQVADVFSGYDLFLFPTRGENYGHVIAESLSVGTPVLLSDQTPWQDMAGDELGWDLPLEQDVFARKIEKVAEMDSKSRLDWRKRVSVNSVSKINNEKDIADNIQLFQFAVERFKQKSPKGMGFSG
jgi:glycosyltransferase involved in cell wall biosynthesis